MNIHPSQREQYIRDAFISGLPADLQLYLGPTISASPGELLQAATYFEQICKKINDLILLFQVQPKCLKLTFPANRHLCLLMILATQPGLT